VWILLWCGLVDGQQGDDGWEDVCCGCIGCEEVARGTGVKDCPLFDGVGVGVDCSQQNRGCEGIVLGGDWVRVRKNNIGNYYTFTIICTLNH
jgi:hypothetical protein